MNLLERINRRTLVLAGAGAAGAGAAIYGGAISAGALKPCPAPGALAGAGDALARIGDAFLSEAATADEHARLTRLAQTVNAAPHDQRDDMLAQTAAALAASPEEDFARGDIVSCAGWVLARGEAMACALVALARPSSGLPPLADI
jgi:hypothetical protein